MAFINLGKIDKNLIPILLGCIFSFLSRLLFKVKNTILFKQKIYPNLLASIIKLVTIIPLIITNKRSQKTTNNNNNERALSNNDIELIYSETDDGVSFQGKFPYIILSTVIQFIQGLLLIYAIGLKSNSWILDIAITSLFYYLIFKIKLFKHHYFSIILIVLIGFIIDLSSENLQKDLTSNLFNFFLRLIREVLYSLGNVINKYLMEKKYVSVYELSVYTGVINSICFGVMEVIDHFYFDLDDLDAYFSNFNSTEILVMLGLLITQLGLYLCTMMTIRNYTPCHVFTILIFGQLANYLDFSAVSIVLIICFVFILFISLIFNEIIEINFWGLSDNTKKNIIARSEAENANLEKNYTMNSIDENGEIRETLVELEKRDSV